MKSEITVQIDENTNFVVSNPNISSEEEQIPDSIVKEYVENKHQVIDFEELN